MIIADMTNADYHAHPSVSKSHLDDVARSPAHYYARRLDPNREPREATKAMEFGTAVHCAVLEPDRFEAEYIVAPKFDRRTKAGKAAAEDFEAQNKGRLWLPRDEYDACRRVRDSVRSHPVVGLLLDSGAAEQSMFWTDPDTGIECKCRPDWLTGDGAVVLDVKTTEDARQEAFARSIVNYRYFVQAPFYIDGVGMATGAVPDLFVFIAVEKSPPYPTAMYFADQQMIEHGRAEYSRNLSTIKASRESGLWLGYPEELMPISMPRWAVTRLDAV